MLLNKDLVIAFPSSLDLFRLVGPHNLKDPDNETKYFADQPWQKSLFSHRIGHWFYHQHRAYRVAFDANLALYVDYDFSLDDHQDWFEILYGEEALPRPDPYDLFLFLKKYCPTFKFFSSFRLIQSSSLIRKAISKNLYPYYWDAFAPHEQKLICEWLLSKDFHFPAMSS